MNKKQSPYKGFIFPCVCHWAWSSVGWLKHAETTVGPSMAGVSFMDFAGSGVVHITGGTAAIAGAYFIGPRIGRFKVSIIKNNY